MRQVGLEVVTYPWFDVTAQVFQFDSVVQALSTAKPGDVVLLQGCCHNPTGADPTQAQWRRLAHLIGERGLIPLVDIAYQGLADGLEADALGARIVVEASEEALLAYSCSKNFGLYRERTGALFLQARNTREAAAARSLLAHLVRVNWSMPPDHGAAVVGMILDTPALKAKWTGELASMRERLSSVRTALASHGPDLATVGSQRGMFSLLSLTPAQIGRLRTEFGVYAVDSGRVNLAGLTGSQVDRFVEALAAVMSQPASAEVAAPV
jgi:aromatic-amino-acid transaminase